jgi:hypothetical protein
MFAGLPFRDMTDRERMISGTFTYCGLLDLPKQPAVCARIFSLTPLR